MGNGSGLGLGGLGGQVIGTGIRTIAGAIPTGRVSEVYGNRMGTPSGTSSSSAVSGGNGGGGGGAVGDMTFGILESPDWEVDGEMAAKFRMDFALPERERLLGCGFLLPPSSQDLC